MEPQHIQPIPIASEQRSDKGRLIGAAAIILAVIGNLSSFAYLLPAFDIAGWSVNVLSNFYILPAISFIALILTIFALILKQYRSVLIVLCVTAAGYVVGMLATVLFFTGVANF